MEKAELLPCPWCGEKLTVGAVTEGSTFRWRKVNGCCADGPEVRHDTMADDQVAAERESHARAIEAWNTRAPLVGMQTAWIVGRTVGSTWEFQGIFMREPEAVAACEDGSWFVAPAVVGVKVPTETQDWPGCYYPLARKEG